MKNLLKLLCIFAAIYCIYFPFSYFKGDADKKSIKTGYITITDEGRAKEIYEEIKAGKNFESVLKEYADEEGIEIESGKYYGRGDTEPEFEKAAFSLKPFQISEPIKTKYGWHILKAYNVIYFSDRKNFDYVKGLIKLNNLYKN